MQRNEFSRFDNAPHVTMNRSKFDLSHHHATTFNASEIIPILCYPDVLPGDTFSMTTSFTARLQTMLSPIFDRLILNTYWFFVPNRLVWEHWPEFMGENKTTPWTQETEFTIPQTTAPEGGWDAHSIAARIGARPYTDNISISSLPLRAIAMVMNEWFRNQNIVDPVNFDIDDTDIVGSNGSDMVTDIVKGGQPFLARRLSDYFSSCLPAPQKGPSVEIPLGDSAPVVVGDEHDVSDKFLKFRDLDGNIPYSNGEDHGMYLYRGTDYLGMHTSDSSLTGLGSSKWVSPSNLVTDLSTATAANINQLRLAFQIQKFYEGQARQGSRYIEVIKGMFGVTSPDARMQRPEYLGGSQQDLYWRTIPQNSATGVSGSSTPQGHLAAMSATYSKHKEFEKSFTEHGILLGFAVVRFPATYSQGIPRGLSRKTKFDFYWPLLANIGEQAVYNKEIFAQGTDADDEVFGYNEAWADYRFSFSRTSGEMSPDSPISLDSWHLGDDYSALPTLSSSWLPCSKSNVDRVLAVKSNVADQIFADFAFDWKAVRIMPTFSIPGLIDHH